MEAMGLWLSLHHQRPQDAPRPCPVTSPQAPLRLPPASLSGLQLGRLSDGAPGQEEDAERGLGSERG